MFTVILLKISLKLVTILASITLEPLQNKNRQMNITNLRLMKNQAVTKVIQMFPPKPRRTDGRPASTQFKRRRAKPRRTYGRRPASTRFGQQTAAGTFEWA